MKTLLQKKKAPKEEPPTAPAAEPPPAPEAAKREQNRLFVLVPEGAFTYRLAALADAQSASRWIGANLIPGQSFLAFRGHHPGAGAKGTRGEALVLVREEGRPDIVQPYSFLDAEQANDFLEREVGASVDPARILFVWAEPVEVPQPVAPVPKPPVAPMSAGDAPAGEDAREDTVAAPTPGIVARIAAWPGWNGLGPALVSAAAGQKRAYYEAIDDDDNAEVRAGLVVTLGGISAAVAALGAGVLAPVWQFAFAMAGWGLAAAVIYAAATALVPGKRPKAAKRRLLVALGFAYAPALLLFLGLMPVFGPLFLLGILLWTAWTFVVAVPVALELETDVGAVIALTGWVFLFALTLVAPSMLM